MAERMTIAQVNRDMQLIAKMVDEHDKILVRGNGEPSMQEDMRTVQKDIAKILTHFEDQKKARASYLKLFIGLVGAQLLAGIVMAAVYFIRVSPYLDEIIRHIE